MQLDGTELFQWKVQLQQACCTCTNNFKVLGIIVHCLYFTVFTSLSSLHCTVQNTTIDAQSCAAELHQALAKSNYQQASDLIKLAPHSGVFEMVNKQQQNALHLAGKHRILLCERSCLL